MELLQLKYFCTAVECESFTGAAARFSVPPSAVSQSVKRLETELACTLFHRWPNRITLTDAGRGFYRRAREALGLLSDAVAALHDDPAEGQIRICINANRRIVVATIEDYKRLYPGVELAVTHLAPPDLDRFDLVVDDAAASPAGSTATLLVEEELLLAVPRGSAYAAAEQLTLADLRDAPFVMMGDASGLPHLIRDLCREAGFSPRVTIRSDDPHYVRRCVELGLGVTLSPAFSWQGQFSEEVVLRPIGGYTRRTLLYTPKERYLPLCARRFCEMLLEKTKP